MNRLEKWFCSSELWRWLTSRRLLPWVLSGCELGDHVLEIGAGAGAATAELRRRVARVTSLEYDHELALRLFERQRGNGGATVQGDAAALPFADGSFSSVIGVLMLHHLQSRELQDRAFAEIRRVLRPGGLFVAFDIPDGWWHRLMHRNSTFVPLAPRDLPERLGKAGLGHVQVDFQRGGFRFRAAARA